MFFQVCFGMIVSENSLPIIDRRSSICPRLGIKREFACFQPVIGRLPERNNRINACASLASYYE